MRQILERTTDVNVRFVQEVISAIRVPPMHGVWSESVLGISGRHLIDMHAVMCPKIRFSLSRWSLLCEILCSTSLAHAVKSLDRTSFGLLLVLVTFSSWSHQSQTRQGCDADK